MGDQGIGIEEKDIKKIFNKFFRVENDTIRSIEGSGLGLYLAHHIITAHEGEITVQSTLGQGTIFYIKLPLIQIQPNGEQNEQDTDH